MTRGNHDVRRSDGQRALPALADTQQRQMISQTMTRSAKTRLNASDCKAKGRPHGLATFSVKKRLTPNRRFVPVLSIGAEVCRGRSQ